MVKVAFVVGLPSHPDQQEKLQLEQKLNCDIIQVNVLDSYSNATLKTANSIQYFYRNNWDDKNGPPNFMVRGDDDIYVNVPKMVEVADKYHKQRFVFPDHTVFTVWLSKEEPVCFNFVSPLFAIPVPALKHVIKRISPC